ncbi:cupredoxin domain-containing protein [Egibacter rhizosphaerae]|uniref:cupredoxin domain-containing protein n=1 Tax=Egibacter rhizosphaerae TaxID=1670831 RepID=UPI0013F16878|nr:plastocyanin/azurin family copper-binding protein [Egibacter rhizosphaerae]
MAAVALLTACDEGDTDTAEEPDAGNDTVAATVTMSDVAFSPETVEIAPGETVEFVNEEQMVHDVAFDDGEASEDLEEGDSYTRTFDEEGEFAYECTYHPGMEGTVIVED